MLSFLRNLAVVIILTPLIFTFQLIKILYLFCKPVLRILGWVRYEETEIKDQNAPLLPAFYRRRFALALGDILYRRHNINCDSYELKVAIDSHRREQLFNALLKETGMQINQDLQTQASHLLKSWLNGFSPEHSAFFYHSANAGIVRDAIAFECVRVVFLIRCMVIFNLIDESRAWFILFLNAQRAQDCFDSWTDFAYAYANGRAAWTAHTGQGGPSQRAKMEVEHYLATHNGNWQTLPWNAVRIFDPEHIPKSAPPV
ncbi:DUF1266 domain-containing protein [Iodobacter arcticus]|uniref:DUF1266 domain-containing protein n=1 Tax=Iodobacter arcticus TaxID=590593 RepID=A0ABW2R1Y9_9NEIS